MKKTQYPLLPVMFAGLLLFGGCASQYPTIAHTHIGHTMDGWPDTPNQAGLFSTAEDAAEAAVQAAESATAPDTNLASIKRNIIQAIKDTNPDYGPNTTPPEKKQYGVKNALAEAAHHVIFAAESPDVSANIKTAGPQFNYNVSFVLSRCDLITALGDEIINSSSTMEANLLSQELLKLTRANRDGDDANGDGIVGSTPEEFGLKQLRAELESIIEREDPPYTTVDSWYLFNLVKLPSGEWIFRKLGMTDANGQSSGY